MHRCGKVHKLSVILAPDIDCCTAGINVAYQATVAALKCNAVGLLFHPPEKHVTDSPMVSTKYMLKFIHFNSTRGVSRTRLQNMYSRTRVPLDTWDVRPCGDSGAELQMETAETDKCSE